MTFDQWAHDKTRQLLYLQWTLTRLVHICVAHEWAHDFCSRCKSGENQHKTFYSVKELTITTWHCWITSPQINERSMRASWGELVMWIAKTYQWFRYRPGPQGIIHNVFFFIFYSSRTLELEILESPRCQKLTQSKKILYVKKYQGTCDTYTKTNLVLLLQNSLFNILHMFVWLPWQVFS